MGRKEILVSLLFIVLFGGGTIFVAKVKKEDQVTSERGDALYFGRYYGDLAHQFDRPICAAKDIMIEPTECAVLDAVLLVMLFLLRGRLPWFGGIVSKTAHGVFDFLDFFLMGVIIGCCLVIDVLVKDSQTKFQNHGNVWLMDCHLEVVWWTVGWNVGWTTGIGIWIAYWWMECWINGVLDWQLDGVLGGLLGGLVDGFLGEMMKGLLGRLLGGVLDWNLDGLLGGLVVDELQCYVRSIDDRMDANRFFSSRKEEGFKKNRMDWWMNSWMERWNGLVGWSVGVDWWMERWNELVDGLVDGLVGGKRGAVEMGIWRREAVKNQVE
ncbi:hypothetical protein BSKO_05397 [Bryopsis sp. KO-2023]|nr:hypothetical protein BSKO_05397 [Bryopsis sp. KO-2023]